MGWIYRDLIFFPQTNNNVTKPLPFFSSLDSGKTSSVVDGMSNFLIPRPAPQNHKEHTGIMLSYIFKVLSCILNIKWYRLCWCGLCNRLPCALKHRLLGNKQHRKPGFGNYVSFKKVLSYIFWRTLKSLVVRNGFSVFRTCVSSVRTVLTCHQKFAKWTNSTMNRVHRVLMYRELHLLWFSGVLWRIILNHL